MAIEVLGFPTTLGLPRNVARHAPEVLREAGLVKRLARSGGLVIDLGDMTPPQGRSDLPPSVQIQQVVEAARWQADAWLRRHTPGNLMLTVGGDHTASLGTLWALNRMDHSFDVVWIDAHGDFNIVETSPSGNPHGMVLALACGLMPQYMAGVIPSTALHLWGIRDLDAGERNLLRRAHAEVLDPARTRQELDRAIERLRPDVFLSFDIDSVDPAEAPGTRTPVPGGFRRQEAVAMVSYLARRRRLLAVDIVEYHPDLDVSGMTADLALDVAVAAGGGHVRTRIPHL